MFKGHCFPKSVILQAVYFKLRFSLSYRDVEELMSIRGVQVDHATIQRWGGNRNRANNTNSILRPASVKYEWKANQCQ